MVTAAAPARAPPESPLFVINKQFNQHESVSPVHQKRPTTKAKEDPKRSS